MNNIALIASGNSVANLIMFMGSIFLARFFDPESFSLLAIFSASVGIFLSILNLRYELAIVIEKSLNQALHLFYLCILLTVIFFILSIMLITFFQNQIISSLSISYELIILIPFFLLFYGFFITFNQWATRQNYFSLIAKYHVIKALITSLIQIVAGVLGFGSYWLVIGFVCGQFVSTTYVSCTIYRRDLNLFKSKINTLTILDLINKYKKFAIFSTPQTIINSLSLYSPSLILATNYPPAIVGSYYFCLKILQSPATIFGQSLRQPFYKEINEILQNNENPIPFLLRNTFFLFAIGFIFFAPIILFGPMIFDFFFGKSFRLTGSFAQWLSIWLLLSLTNIPAISSLHALEELKLLYIWELLNFVVRIGGFFYFSLVASALISVAFFSVIGAIFNFSIILIALNKLYRVNYGNL